ncbi:SpoIIE family protein phosphatase [Streptomyces sp. NBRC 109706]|uniref:SpoIIE family protein phosphatase n=1 Tax=Streptomyces sp. NBRC 109706 TaxID=1550035 RepID=UPI000786701B|nr:SpoIIE family protein phosphatase [Streptomyces sp. NBRC 109706]
MSDSPARGPEILVPAFNQVIEESGAHGGLLMLLSPNEAMLRMALVSGFPVKFTGPWKRIWLNADFAIARAARERRQIWMGPDERATDYPESAVAAPYPYAVADTPLFTGDRLWGVLNILWPGSHPAEPVPAELAAVDAGALRLSELLNRYAQEGRPVRPLPEPLAVPRQETSGHAEEDPHAGARFAERLPGGSLAMNLEGEVTFVTRGAAELLGCPVTDLLGALPWDVLPWLSDPVYEDGYRRALFTREPTSFTVLRPPDRWLSVNLFPGISGISARVWETAPPDENPRSGPPGRTAEAEARVAEATQAGDEAPTRVGSVYHLMHLSLVLGEAIGVRDIVTIVRNPVMSAFEADAIVLLTVEGDRLRLLGHRGLTDEFAEELDHHPLDGGSAAARCVRDQQALFFSTPEELDRDRPGWSATSGLAACALLPLSASGRPVGCVGVGYREPYPFGSGHRTLFTSLSGLLAQSLDRALLYDTQHQLAHRLQELLLPRELPEIPGVEVAARYRAATRGLDVGGDFYDLIPLDGHCAAAVGDVQGHNMTAAALMGEVRAAVHATAGTDPGDVLMRSNRLLTDLGVELFTSCLYVYVDFTSHRARLATAGHLPPLMVDPEGEVTILDVTPGPLLGIDPTARYTSTEIPLPPGSALLLYTDGLVERPGVDIGDSLAELADRLRAVAHESPGAIADALLDEAPRTRVGPDDVALLLVRCATTPNGRPIRSGGGPTGDPTGGQRAG